MPRPRRGRSRRLHANHARAPRVTHEGLLRKLQGAQRGRSAQRAVVLATLHDLQQPGVHRRRLARVTLAEAEEERRQQVKGAVVVLGRGCGDEHLDAFSIAHHLTVDAATVGDVQQQQQRVVLVVTALFSADGDEVGEGLDSAHLHELRQVLLALQKHGQRRQLQRHSGPEAVCEPEPRGDAREEEQRAVAEVTLDLGGCAVTVAAEEVGEDRDALCLGALVPLPRHVRDVHRRPLRAAAPGASLDGHGGLQRPGRCASVERAVLPHDEFEIQTLRRRRLNQ